MAGIKIKGFGRSHGDCTVTNDDLAGTVDTSDKWIREKTGIRSRYFARDLTNGDMACLAAESALARANVPRERIGLLLVCTFTPDEATPSVACQVAGRLGLREDLMAMDLNGACTGFIYGCALADAMLAAGRAEYALIIGSEKISPLMDMHDRGTCVLFGDGAGAVVVSREEDGAFESMAGCQSDGDVLHCDRFDPAIRMKGQEVYRFAVSKIVECTERMLGLTGTTAEDIDYYICHQANERIIDSAAGKTGIAREKFFKNLYSYGNTSAASIPIALCEMYENDMLKSGMTVICTGFGAGLTYGSMMIKI